MFDPQQELCDACLQEIVFFGCFRCTKCGIGIPLGSNPICPECSNSKSPVSHTICVGPYEPPLRNMILNLKARGATSITSSLASLLAAEIRRDGRLEGDEVIVPVPSSPKTLRMRGYNHAELLANAVAKNLGLPFLPDALSKIRHTEDQASLPRLARIRNLEGCFSAKRGAVEGQSILLIDDITTTGTTLRECARALKQEGAFKVSAAVLALTVRHGDTASYKDLRSTFDEIP
jgi:ComF family protein